VTSCRTVIAEGRKSSDNGAIEEEPSGQDGRSQPSGLLRLIKELLLAATLCLIYEVIRHNLMQSGAAAIKHALWIVQIERAVGLFHEESVQSAFLHVPNLVRAFNLYYGGTHFLIPLIALVWLWWRYPRQYARARTALAVITGLAFLAFWLFPEAPPRLLPRHFGFADTLDSLGKTGHLESSLLNSAGDLYAAMPSVHVAWAVWCTLALYPVIRNRALRAVLIAYPVMTTLVVVVTGNHFFLDAAGGSLLAGTAWLAVNRLHEPLSALALNAWALVTANRIAPVPATASVPAPPRTPVGAPHPRLPELAHSPITSHANGNRNGNGHAGGNAHATSNGYSTVNSNGHTSSNGHASGDGDGDGHASASKHDDAAGWTGTNEHAHTNEQFNGHVDGHTPAHRHGSANGHGSGTRSSPANGNGVATEQCASSGHTPNGRGATRDHAADPRDVAEASGYPPSRDLAGANGGTPGAGNPPASEDHPQDNSSGRNPE
jgi:hypothetical protein